MLNADYWLLKFKLKLDSRNIVLSKCPTSIDEKIYLNFSILNNFFSSFSHQFNIFIRSFDRTKYSFINLF